MEKNEDESYYIDDLKVSKDEHLLDRFLESFPIGSAVIWTFNEWLDKMIPEQLSRISYQTDKKRVYLEYTKCEPSHETPNEARLKKETYFLRIFAKFCSEEYIKDRKDPVKIYDVEMSYMMIPLMVGSKGDKAIFAKSDKELYRIGEDPQDPFGYFIHKGNQLLFNNQSGLHDRTPFLMRKKDPLSKGHSSIVCQFIAPYNTYRPSQLLIYDGKIKINKKKPNTAKSIEVYISGFIKSEKQQTLPLFMIYYVFGVGPNKATRMILSYISSPNFKDRAKAALTMTERRFNKIYEKYLSCRTNTDNEDFTFLSYIENYIGSRKSPSEIEDQKWNIIARLFSNLYPHTTQKDVRNLDKKEFYQAIGEKLNLLSAHTAKLLEWKIGERQLDDLNSLSNKRIQPASEMLHKLVTEVIVGAMSDFDRQNKGKEIPSLSTYRAHFQKMMEKSRSTFETRLQPGQWKVGQKSKYNDTVTEYVINSTSLLSLKIDCLKVRKPTDPKSRDLSVRATHGSEWGFMCAIHTPDDKKCGLIQYLTILARITPISSSNHLIAKYIYSNIKENNEIDDSIPLIFNGIIIKSVGYSAYDILKDAKIKGDIDNTTGIVLMPEGLYVYTFSCRLIRPLLVVKNNEVLIEKHNAWNKSINKLFRRGYIEYLDSWEQESEKTIIATSLDDLREKVKEQTENIQIREDANDFAKKEYKDNKANIRKDNSGFILQIKLTELKNSYMNKISKNNKLIDDMKKYTISHCEISRNTMFGVSASMIPFPGCNPGARNMFQCKMNAQAASCPTRSFSEQTILDAKILINGSRPFIEPFLGKRFGLNEVPIGTNLVLAIMAYPGNQEDSIVINKSTIERGALRITNYITISESVQTMQGAIEKFAKPKVTNISEDAYRHLDDDGIPSIGQYIQEGDVIIGKRRTRTSTSGESIEDMSYYATEGDIGIIHRVDIIRGTNGIKRVIVKIKNTMQPEIGDKLAARCAQKGTIGEIRADVDMPFTESGVTPDIVINPHCIPGRMTMALLKEIIGGKLAALTSTRLNANSPSPTYEDDVGKALVNLNYAYNGKEFMTDGRTGEPIMANIYIGICYYLRLKHLSHKKIQMCPYGSKEISTHQPSKNNLREPSKRAGEMEMWAFASHGSSAVLRSVSMNSSDLWESVVCVKCGRLAVSSIAEGTNSCPSCNTINDQDFAKIEVPYVCKRLSHYLTAMGINFNISGKVE